VEPKSPGKPITFKRKAYSTTGTNSIGHLEPYDDELDPPQGSSKYQKTGAGETAVVRSNATTPPNNPHTALRLTRHSARSAKANSKKTVGKLVERLGREFQAIAKTCEGIAEAINMDT
jgi:hypothetical protein